MKQWLTEEEEEDGKGQPSITDAQVISLSEPAQRFHLSCGTNI